MPLLSRRAVEFVGNGLVRFIGIVELEPRCERLHPNFCASR